MSLLNRIAVVVLVALPCAAAPEPDPVPQRWEFDVEFGPLQTIEVEIPLLDESGQEVRDETGSALTERRGYFFLTYLVTNHTGDDRLFAPHLELGADDGSLVTSGLDVPPEATRAILRELQNPFLEDQISIIGKIQQGEENAREGLAVWPITDYMVDEVVVYAAGFSGETDVLEWKDPESDEPIKVILRKTYEMRYTTPGQIDPGDPHPLPLSEPPRWIMR